MNNWWKSFFNGIWIDLAIRDEDSPTTLHEADGIARLLNLRAGMRVLDVPCGSGRLSLALARLGIRMTGVDQSNKLLEAAELRARPRLLPAQWHCGDMRALPWKQQFDAAFCYWGSFGYFDDADNLRFLSSIRRALRPGGRFLLDTPVKETLLHRIHSWSAPMLGGFVTENCLYNPATERVDSAWTFQFEQNIAIGCTSIRLYSSTQLLTMLRRADFARLEASYATATSPRGLEDRLVIIAHTD